jgi:transcriptional regulator with XRE-family HTH domain
MPDSHSLRPAHVVLYQQSQYALYQNMRQPHIVRFVQEQSGGIEPAFGRWAKDMRKRAQRSQSDVSEDLAARGVMLDASAISRIESGERSVRLSEAVAIAAVLGVPLLAEPVAARLEDRVSVEERLHDLADRAGVLRRRSERIDMERASVHYELESVLEQIRSLEIQLAFETAGEPPVEEG